MLGAIVLSSCSSPTSPHAKAPIRGVPAIPAPVSGIAKPASMVSMATTALDYRHDAASHLYQQNPGRIYKGVLPPLLYAVGVLQVQVGTQGQLLGMSWLRAPDHAPEVVAEIERTVRQAAPFPAPLLMGTSATYIETWLWDASGRFQLHTLTEGQSYEGDVMAEAVPVPHDVIATTDH